MPDGSLPTIIGMLICLAFSAFFSASETAFTSFSRTKMKTKAEEGNKKAKLVLKMSDDYDKLLSTILVGNNIVNIALSSMATIWFLNLLANSAAVGYASTISTVITTVVVLIFGEITPKSIAKDHPEGLAMGVCRFLKFLCVILTPVNFIFSLWKKLINLIIKPNDDEAVTEGEVLTLVDEAHEDGIIDEYNKELIENIFEFDDLTAGEIATHRIEITMLSTDSTPEEWDEIIYGSRFSRYPVYTESVDNIVGILDARAYFRLESNDRDTVLREAVIPAYFVPKTVKADVLFRNMKAKKESCAIVLDEYGGVLGIITLTDLVECLVGEFNETDENEEHEELISTVDENVWQIGGTASVSDVEEALGVEIADEDSDTFGGYVLGLYGSIPDDGSTFKLETDTLDISIEGIKDHKIEKAIVTLKTQDDTEDTEEGDE